MARKPRKEPDADLARRMTVDEAWRVLTGREPSKAETLALAWEEAMARHKRAVEARDRAFKAEQKAWEAQNAAWDAYMAEADAARAAEQREAERG